MKSEFTQQLYDVANEDLPSLLFYNELDVRNEDKRRDV